MEPEAGHQMQHRMFRLPLGDWHVAGMGQVFPVVTTGGPDNGDGGELRRTEWYLTQPALMANLESPSRRLALRTGPAGSDDFFRYDPDGLATGATRWLIATAAYARQLSSDPVSLRPFLEVQYHRVRAERGDVPRGGLVVLGVVPGSEALPGRRPSANGRYGVLDPMTTMGWGMSS